MPTTRAILLKPFVDSLLKRQMDAGAFLHGYGLHVEDAYDAHKRISFEQLFQIQEDLAIFLGEPTLGLRLGAETSAIPHGALKHILAGSRSLDSALRAFSAYANAIEDGWNIRLETNEIGIQYIYDYDSQPGRFPVQDVDYSMARICGVIRWWMGARWNPLEIHLQHTSPNRRLYESVFGSPVCFGQSVNCVVLSDDDIDRTIEPVKNPQRAGRRHQPRPQVTTDIDRSCIGECVALWVRRNIGKQDIVIERFANDFGMSVRTVQRLLTLEGVGFREIVKDQRRQIAEAMLASQPSIPCTQLALSLGYADASAFSRAFKEWTGRSPSESYRAGPRHAGTRHAADRKK